jgi:hypothetical protein
MNYEERYNQNMLRQSVCTINLDDRRMLDHDCHLEIRINGNDYFFKRNELETIIDYFHRKFTEQKDDAKKTKND